MVLDHAQTVVAGETGEQRIVAGHSEQVDPARAALGLSGLGRHLAAGDVGEQLGAEADTEHRHVRRQGLTYEAALTREERGALVVVGHQAAAEQHQPVHHFTVAQVVRQVRSVNDNGIDLVLGKPCRQATRAAACRVLHDDHARLTGHASIPAAVSAVRSA